ncbi:MAG: AAA family ATPase [Promethearchaeota archaeon]|nr:MAG: AAA family ATPase [Candidatus Lokiarchaeota archaeon]
MEIITISGTPGCGKTSVAKVLAEKNKVKFISLNTIAIDKNFLIRTDSKRNTQIIDEEKIIDYLNNKIEKLKLKDIDYLIIESHFSDIIPAHLINFAIILRCHPDELLKRLENRGYSEKKIYENAQAEILGNCTSYFLEKNLRVPLIEVDTTHKTILETANIIWNIILTKRVPDLNKIGRTDWLEQLYQKNRIEDFFEK